jgi:hypothetical protein
LDIHKPKPWHGLREFLKEYLIIVIGVLTALAGEQVVERIRDQRDVAETREALHAEISQNAMHAKVTIAENSCSDAFRVKTLAWLNGGPKPEVKELAMLLPLSSTVWETAHNKGVALMPMDEQLALARYYEEIRLYNENEAARREVGLRGASILMLDRITPEQGSRFAEASNGSAILRRYQSGNAQRAMDVAITMKIKPDPVAPDIRAQLERYCSAVGVAVPPL